MGESYWRVPDPVGKYSWNAEVSRKLMINAHKYFYSQHKIHETNTPNKIAITFRMSSVEAPMVTFYLLLTTRESSESSLPPLLLLLMISLRYLQICFVWLQINHLLRSIIWGMDVKGPWCIWPSIQMLLLLNAFGFWSHSPWPPLHLFTDNPRVHS